MSPQALQPWNWQAICLTLSVGKGALALILAALLGTPASFGEQISADSIASKARNIPPNSPVEVRLMDGTKLRGWIGESSETGFVLSQEQDHRLQKRMIAFREIKSLKQIKNVKPGHTTRNILIGVGITVVVLGGIFAAAAASGGIYP